MHNLTIKLCFAVCTHNRVSSLRALLPVMRRQYCGVSVEVLVVDSASTESARSAVELEVQRRDGAPVRYVYEEQKGIVAARNRAIEEARECDYLMFIDDDEVPGDGLLDAALKAIQSSDADCVGGRIHLVFPGQSAPAWFSSDHAHRFGAVDHGNEAFQLKDESKPVWASNMIYNMRVFNDAHAIRFDARYDRVGHGPSASEDAQMLRLLLSLGKVILYSPDMCVYHLIHKERLSRRYLIYKNYRGGFSRGLHRSPDVDRSIAGVPYFMLMQVPGLCVRAAVSYVARNKKSTLELTKVASHFGDMAGRFHKRKYRANSNRV